MKTKGILVSLFFLILIIGSMTAETLISGTISTSQTWTWEGSPYIVSGTVNIQGVSNPVVTIQSRTVVKFNAGAEIVVGHASSSSLRGGIVTNGLITYPVRFTANQEMPTPGFWKHIKINAFTVDGQVNFSRAVFEYGGSVNGMLEVTGSFPQVTNCTFRYSQKMGLYHSSLNHSAVMSNTYFNNNGTYPLNWNQNYLYNLGTGCSFTNNGTQRILIVSQNITTPQTWINPGIPYEPDNDITVYTGNDPLLLANGTTIAFRTGARLIIGHPSSSSFIGCLQADGVTFTGITQTPGSWAGIYALRYINTAQTIIDNCTVSYAGGTYGGMNTAVNIGNYSGINLTNCTISSSPGWGIYLGTNSNQATITGCNLVSNFRSVSLPAPEAWRLGGGNTYAGTDDLRPEIRSGIIGTTCFLTKQPVPWFINGTVNVHGNGAPMLTIEDNSRLEFLSGSKITLGSTNSTNLAAGLNATNVTFTADYEAQYRWQGMEFYRHSLASNLTNCQFRAFGSGNVAGLKLGGNQTVTVDSCSFTIGNAYAIEASSEAQFSLLDTVLLPFCRHVNALDNDNCFYQLKTVDDLRR